MSSIWLRRAYDKPGRLDGQRILVDRLWPRGVAKDVLKLDEWAKDIAPSNELRKWFDHDPDKWNEFRRRYAEELENRIDAVTAMRARLNKGRVTFVYGAKDEKHNQARALKDWFEEGGDR